ncbi:CPBP family intramembrane glutamic endopeptidase [Haladaptatus sp. AB643]|uniref:CPBP family intramembrane glutamic endopeptidase n=1 Tax=Haladaptatus sp. AB643 TaxID=2934174 RepID=UPI00209BC9D3|nr:CPBP family intramembrane glutamic endopeptidase [Haladaptatus sp. AB643]MCO8244343.1 CPBP family intramembrane metalloprotease [Haladaptatus sp. AB643]
MQTPSTAERARQSSFVKGVVTMFVLGLPGVVVVGVSLLGSLRSLPQFAGASTPALFLLIVTQPLLLLALSCLVGTALAPRTRLKSHVLYRIVGRTQPPVLFGEELPAAIGVGVGVAVIAIALDGLFTVLVPGLSPLVVRPMGDPTVFSVLETVSNRFLYGGITEELFLRYGFMTLVVWGCWKLAGGKRPSSRVMWTAIGISALVFGLGHLLAMVAFSSVAPALLVQIVLTNAVIGVGLGWLYWGESLESAMVGHISFGVVVMVVSLLLSL